MLGPPLIALTPGALAADDLGDWMLRARRAVDAGLRGVILREAGLSDASYLEWAHAMRALLPRGHGGWLCVHDRAHLVAAIDADALHLGGASLRPCDVREWLPADVSIGLSTHAGDDPAEWDTADYVVHGPVQRSTKPGARDPIGFEALERAVRASPCPVWALGGLQPGDAAPVHAAGARGMAVLAGVFGARDPAAAVRAYLERWMQTERT